jgi:hypothetical protein
MRLSLIGPGLIEVTKRSTNKSTVGNVLYQGIEADGATDDIPSGAKGKSSETLRLERSVGRHDVGERACRKGGYLCMPEGVGRWVWRV